VPAVCVRERMIARRSQPPRPTSTRKPGIRTHTLAQIAHQNEPVVTSKCASGRPLLIDSAPQTEFALTHSKQTTEKFLTGARTHIRIFSFCTFTTQNPTQLIHRLLIYLEEKHPKSPASVNLFLSRLPAAAGRFTRASLRFNTRSVCDNRRRNPYQIPKTVPPGNSTVTLFLSRLPAVAGCFTRASLRFQARSVSDNRRSEHPSNRFWPENRSYRKQTTRPRLTGSRIHIRIFRFWPSTTQNPARRLFFTVDSHSCASHDTLSSRDCGIEQREQIKKCPTNLGRTTKSKL
jgi:hypothetical protein